ncbi:hypothetical protein CERZMDRAFT_103193 [Cercospora zeae-maydis SCOH1-5]|uniref:C2H2-type domain-containing protein n=1 Tax=Cercospora zeae-maydis SCOH1-5 TaxID=717836 RepID=A0A6A6EYW3_9PEZI|nr:hypothetical protein CERZMDRAFT_103193 [Cercospora zeae-maydis SCOH1-5]
MSRKSVDETPFPVFLNKVISCDFCNTWFAAMSNLKDHLRVCEHKPEPSDDTQKVAKMDRRGRGESGNAGSVEHPRSKQKARGFVPARSDGEESSHTSDSSESDSNPEGITDDEDWATNHPAHRDRPGAAPLLPAQQTPPRPQTAEAGNSSGKGKRPSLGSDRMQQKKSRASMPFTFSSPTTPTYTFSTSRGTPHSARVRSAYSAFPTTSPSPKTPEAIIAQALKHMVAGTVNAATHNERPRHERQIATTFEEYRKGEEERFQAALARQDYSKPGEPLDRYITELVDERFNFRWEFMNDGFALNAAILKVLKEQVDVRFEERVQQLKDVRGWEQGPATVRDAVVQEIQRRSKLKGETEEQARITGGDGQEQDMGPENMSARDLALAKLMGTTEAVQGWKKEDNAC